MTNHHVTVNLSNIFIHTKYVLVDWFRFIVCARSNHVRIVKQKIIVLYGRMCLRYTQLTDLNEKHQKAIRQNFIVRTDITCSILCLQSNKSASRFSRRDKQNIIDVPRTWSRNVIQYTDTRCKRKWLVLACGQCQQPRIYMISDVGRWTGLHIWAIAPTFCLRLCDVV